MENVTDIIAKNIKERRKALGLTQMELGVLLGYSVKAISKWESGKGAPPTVVLPLLAQMLRTDVDFLLREQTERRFYLGIDGGGTKTEFALADDEGHVIKTLLLGTSNPSDIGMSAAKEVWRTGISEVCAALPKGSISLFAGLAGGTTHGVSEEIDRFFGSFGFHSVRHGSDAENAISAGLGQRDGIITIMGTGSVAFAQCGGKRHRVGGYGYLLADAGSGFAFGRDAIAAALQYEDGSGEDTLLYESVKAKCGAKTVLEKLGLFYEGGKRAIADYASCVFDAYRHGDALAHVIVERNLQAVAQTVRGAGKHLKDASRIPVVLCGGICQSHGDVVVPVLGRYLSNENYEISLCEHSLIYGALRLAGMPEGREEKGE